MGATLAAIIMSPWGKQSGGHFNPAITFAFYRLGKVEFWDAWFYVASQFLGAITGVIIAGYALRGAPANQAVRYAVTVPGMWGSFVAFVAEVRISFVLMVTVLFVTNRERLAPYTAYIVGILTAAYITFEWPLSGMSTNPARTLGPANLRPRMACALDLLHRTFFRHVGCRRGFSASPPGRRAVLRQATSRQ